MRKTEKMSTPPYVRLRYLLVWRMRICGVVKVLINKSYARLLPCLCKNRKLIADHSALMLEYKSSGSPLVATIIT